MSQNQIPTDSEDTSEYAKRYGYRNGENPECIRVQYDSITFPKENKGKLIYFQQKIRRYFTMWMKKTAGIAGNVWKRWDFLLVLK